MQSGLWGGKISWQELVAIGQWTRKLLSDHRKLSLQQQTQDEGKLFKACTIFYFWNFHGWMRWLSIPLMAAETSRAIFPSQEVTGDPASLGEGWHNRQSVRCHPHRSVGSGFLSLRHVCPPNNAWLKAILNILTLPNGAAPVIWRKTSSCNLGEIDYKV
jgi:hypothetical protein